MKIEGVMKALELRFASEEDILHKIECSSHILALLKIEDKYGPFTIYFNDSTFKKKDTAAAELLFNKHICELSHEFLIFYDKRIYRPMAVNAVYGVSLDELAIKYIDLCLHYNTLIRYKNADGEGYATNNIREIIMTEGVPLACIKSPII